ncbi:serine/threonine protein kinase [Streptomyces gardneri]|uniref:serine/threonine-protein kinase n=1 Tax=Nocardia TaxID=1817 RepID=UPI001358046D|nr:MULTISPECIES: serine/threonine-protein kinase [Nocardia]MBF6163660.1 serine/threonine protein kinase [Streptomyces gardneri]
MLASGDVFAGYVIERQLGRGGMGSVYLAKHPRLPRMTALKLLNREMFFDKEVRARFEREADLVAQLDHPNIVTVYDRGLEDEQLWISMQYIDGIDAASVEPRSLPPERAVQIIKETADALDYAHGSGVLHRDVKPANILLARSSAGRGERVYLTDFGIARLRDDTGHLTQTGTFTATLAYASPEQLTGVSLDHRSDQYSLACSLFWLFTGTGPFSATNPAAVIQGHLQGAPPALSSVRPGLPFALDGVLAKAMAKRPDDRYGSCAEFAAAAKQALTGSSAPSMPVVGGPRPVTGPPHPTTGPRPTTGPQIPTTGSPYPVGHYVSGPGHQTHAPHTSGPTSLAASAAPAPPTPVVNSGPHPTATNPYSHQQSGFSAFGAPPAPPHGAHTYPSAGSPPKKNTGLIVGSAVGVVVLILVVLGIIGATSDSGSNNAGATTTSAVKPNLVEATPESVSAEFPRMVPASKTEDVGYNGAECWLASSSSPPSPSKGEPDFGDWAAQWRCFKGGNNEDPYYRIYAYKTPADVQAVLKGLPSSATKSTDTNGGKSYTNYKYVDDGAKMVTAFTGDPDRTQYLMYTDGFSHTTIDELLRWWRSAPLN